MERVVLFRERISTKGIAIEGGIKITITTFFLVKYRIRNCETSSKVLGLRAK
jgi:hypothetical protein